MTGEEAIGWGSLAIQVIRSGVLVVAGGWVLLYGIRGFLKMASPWFS